MGDSTPIEKSEPKKRRKQLTATGKVKIAHLLILLAQPRRSHCVDN
jgi:hypothetical protein